MFSCDISYKVQRAKSSKNPKRISFFVCGNYNCNVSHCTCIFIVYYFSENEYNNSMIEFFWVSHDQLLKDKWDGDGWACWFTKLSH